MLSGGKTLRNDFSESNKNTFSANYNQQHLSKLWQKRMNTLISIQNLLLKSTYVLKVFSEVAVTTHRGYDELF